MLPTHTLGDPLLAEHGPITASPRVIEITVSPRDIAYQNQINALLTVLHTDTHQLRVTTPAEVTLFVNQWERQLKLLLEMATSIENSTLQQEITQEIYSVFSQLMFDVSSIYHLPVAIELIQCPTSLKQLYFTLGINYHREYISIPYTFDLAMPGLPSIETHTMPFETNYQYCICFLCYYQKSSASDNVAATSARWLAQQISLNKESLPVTIKKLAEAGLKDQAFLWLAQAFYQLSLSQHQSFAALWLHDKTTQRYLNTATAIIDTCVTDETLATKREQLQSSIEDLDKQLQQRAQTKWQLWQQPKPSAKALQHSTESLSIALKP